MNLKATVVIRVAVVMVLSLAGRAGADEPASTPGVERWERFGDHLRDPSFEVNVFGPLIGLFDLRFVDPVLRPTRDLLRGEWVLGLSTDYSFGPLSRPVDQYGKVYIIAGKFGWRQYLVGGLHVELDVNLGWRHEADNHHDGSRTLDGAYGRFYALAGWSFDVTSRLYLGVRGGLGLFLFRSDRFGDTEKKVIPAGELNLGLRF